MMSEQKISKKSWSSQEDSLLLALIEEYGASGSWPLISTKIGDRTGKQCRERYYNHLKPDITKVTWTVDEDALLLQSQKVMGNQWAKIAKLLPGRSDNSVKNRWHIINRKKSVTTTEHHVVKLQKALDKRTVDTAVAPCVAHTMKLSPSSSSIIATRPIVPKLALSALTQSTQQHMSVTVDNKSSSYDVTNQHGFNQCNEICGESDLLDLYYSHESHCHQVTDTSRSYSDYYYVSSSSCPTNCPTVVAPPASGRRDFDVTAIGFDDEIFNDPDYIETLEQLINEEDSSSSSGSSCSFNNTLSSCISELSLRSGGGAADDFHQDHQDHQGRQYRRGNTTTITTTHTAAAAVASIVHQVEEELEYVQYQYDPAEAFEDQFFNFDGFMDDDCRHASSSSSYNAMVQRKEEYYDYSGGGGGGGGSDGVDIDRFSEPALSFRDMETVLDDLFLIDDVDDDGDDDCMLIDGLGPSPPLGAGTVVTTATATAPIIDTQSNGDPKVDPKGLQLDQHHHHHHLDKSIKLDHQYHHQQQQQSKDSKSQRRSLLAAARNTPRSPALLLAPLMKRQRQRATTAITPRSVSNQTCLVAIE